MDSETIDRLIAAHADRAYALALRLTGNAADAGDVVQDAFVRALRYMDRYDTTLPFEGWLSQIVRNVYLSSLKAEARRRSLPLSAEDEEGRALEERLADPAPGPEAEADRGGRADDVQRALALLPPAARAAVVFVDLEGLGREEAARALGCSLAALDVRLHRARARLRELLEDRP